MNVAEAIKTVKTVGRIRVDGTDLVVRFPSQHRPEIKDALNTLKVNKREALRLLAEVPPAEHWPESLRELAAEVSTCSADPGGARREVWMNWCEWKARMLNGVFQEQGTSERPSQIVAATVQHGERDKTARGGN